LDKNFLCRVLHVRKLVLDKGIIRLSIVIDILGLNLSIGNLRYRGKTSKLIIILMNNTKINSYYSLKTRVK